MKYEKPEWEIIELKKMDIITQSTMTGENDGDGPGFGGSGEYPWEE